LKYEVTKDNWENFPLWGFLQDESKEALLSLGKTYRWTYQEKRILIDTLREREQAGRKGFDWTFLHGLEKKRWWIQFTEIMKKEKGKRDLWENFSPSSAQTPTLLQEEGLVLGLGRCPVYSPKTRCCGLYTLDVVQGCGFSCRYCSLGAFLEPGEGKIAVDAADQIRKINLGPEVGHLGTGQSSDSLFWGNAGGVLDAVLDLAERHPGTVIELKTKSVNVGGLKNRKIPPNLVVTWSLNTDIVQEMEELGTPSVARRIQTAREVADLGVKVGFHFHPMIDYQGCESDYLGIIENLSKNFVENEVVMTSFGILTYSPRVLKKLRERELTSRLFSLPLTSYAGKLTYDFETKLRLLTPVVSMLKKDWPNVFMYLCMEEPELWQPVLGRTYPDNDAFEIDMVKTYRLRMGLIKD